MRSKISHILIICTLIGLSLSCSRREAPVRHGLARSYPETQGVATVGILHFLEEVEARGLELHSFMLVRHGKVVSECWWHPYRASAAHVMHSVSKTFTSTAIGFAVNEKLLKVNDKVVTFFPDDLPPSPSPYLQELTVKDLLTMTAGHANAPVFTQNDENWVRSFLATPIVHEPGTRFQYSSYASYMLSAIITRVTGETVMEYLQPRLFEPLDITDAKWEMGEQGISAGGWGLRLKTIDMAKMGQFYLQRGVWNGKRLLPASWFEEATTPYIYQKPDKTPEENAQDEWAQGYGYQLWLCTHNTYRADGANGQFIVVMPDQDAVVAITAKTGQMGEVIQLIWDKILPAISTRSLPPEEGDWEQLNTLQASREIKKPFVAFDEAVVTETTRSYSIESNDAGFQNMIFQFDKEGNCQLTLKTDKRTYTYAFGSGNWKYGETDRPGPYFRNARRNLSEMAPFPVAGYGCWTKADELSLRLLYLSESVEETFICTFNKDKVKVELTNSVEPNKPSGTFTGKQHET